MPTPTNVFSKQLAHVNSLLVKMDEKADDLNHLRWQAAKGLAQLHADGMTIDQLAINLNRKPADVRSFITTWKAYGNDVDTRTDQTYSALQRLVKRHPDDPKARAVMIAEAKAKGISVATVMDHQGYRGGIRSGGKGSRTRGPEDSFVKQLLAMGAPLDVQEAWYGLDSALHHFRSLVESEAVLDQGVTDMITARIKSVTDTWQKVSDISFLANMAQGEGE